MIRRANRFHGHHSVSKVRGDVLHGRFLSLRFAPNKKHDYRLAVVVSKKVASKAVTRNRIRRRVFELVRSQGRVTNTPIDAIFYAKTADIASISAQDLADEVLSLTKKALSRLS
ncbi:ribonuclease P protein component [Candidatus Saccharibacteria bacterium]|nr:ribonuclease P protein component [Candidatus Saccharibacteria bacterium]MCA9328275.1 ribonuclease P protein component [Candidatus Saccharibacteria bacterium]